MKTSDLIDQARQRSGIVSDYAVAKRLAVTRQTVSAWRSGVNYPNLLQTYQLAELAQLDPGRVVAELELDRAERNGRDDQAGGWRELLQRVAAGVAAVTIGAAVIGPAPANSQGMTRVSGSGGLYIMSTRRRNWRAFLGLMPLQWRRLIPPLIPPAQAPTLNPV